MVCINTSKHGTYVHAYIHTRQSKRPEYPFFFLNKKQSDDYILQA